MGPVPRREDGRRKGVTFVAVVDSRPEGAGCSDPAAQSDSALRQRIIDHGYEDLLFLEPAAYDDAIVGVAEGRWDRTGHRDDVVVYDLERVVEITHQMLGGEEEGDLEDALEYVSFNIVGGYLGPTTPIFVRSRDWFARE